MLEGLLEPTGKVGGRNGCRRDRNQAGGAAGSKTESEWVDVGAGKELPDGGFSTGTVFGGRDAVGVGGRNKAEAAASKGADAGAGKSLPVGGCFTRTVFRGMSTCVDSVVVSFVGDIVGV